MGIKSIERRRPFPVALSRGYTAEARTAQVHTAAASSIKEVLIEFPAEWEPTERRGKDAGENQLNERAVDTQHQACRNPSLSVCVCVYVFCCKHTQRLRGWWAGLHRPLLGREALRSVTF